MTTLMIYTFVVLVLLIVVVRPAVKLGSLVVQIAGQVVAEVKARRRK
jgi:hypothetical protein